jgi:hypothetical protein
MGLDILKEKGTPIAKQLMSWRQMVQPPYNKLDDDAFTRVRVILMNGIESEAVRFSHAAARLNGGELLSELALIRRLEQHQQTQVNWLNPADQSPIETTIGFEQVAIEVTYLAQVYRFGLLEDFDHMYRFAALYDRLDGGDANAFLQSYTDILPGRPTRVEHRHPDDDLRKPYRKESADPLSKIHATLITAAENQTHDYYMTIGPMFSDPLARQLYAEIASIEEQHTTHYESLIDPSESWIEKWLMHECVELYGYYSCLQSETNPRIKKIWEKLVADELGHLHFVADLFEKHDGRSREEVLPKELPEPIAFQSHREFVRNVLRDEVQLRASGADFVDEADEPERSLDYRARVNADVSPSDETAASFVWTPGTEQAAALLQPATKAETTNGHSRHKTTQETAGGSR